MSVAQGSASGFIKKVWRWRNRTAFVSALLLALSSVVSAHGGGETTGGLSRWHGAVLVAVGVASVAILVALRRRGTVSARIALYGVLSGVFVSAIGVVLFDGLSPDPTYTASTMPFPRSWYPYIGASVGGLIASLSLTVGWFRWQDSPRYTALGILMGAWVSYPYLIPGGRGYSNPLGYFLVLITPVAVGYIVYKDASGILLESLKDKVARRFALGIGSVVAFFFVSMTGYLTFFPEEGVPRELTIAVLPAVYQIVSWPTLEIYVPDVPFFVAASPGQIILVGTISVLVGLNAAVVGYSWRVGESAGLVQGTGGSATVFGACTCGCCGPFAAKVAVVALGSGVAAPLYWLFVDSASPFTTLLTVGAIGMFAFGLVYSARRVTVLGEGAQEG